MELTFSFRGIKLKSQNSLKVSPLEGNHEYWVVLEDYERRGVKVPAGFITNFLTRWGFLKWIIPAWGKYGWAAVIHDFLYESGIYARKMADLVFLRVMEDDKVNKFVRVLFYIIIRLIGWYRWNQLRAIERKMHVKA